MNNNTLSITTRLLKWIAKYSILPATIFTKLQVNTIHQEFCRFWGLENSLPSFKQPARFSTFTLGSPLNLWSYYFSTLADMEALRARYTLNPLQVHTQDDVTLCGMHFQDHRAASHPQARTLIVFGGNGELYKIGASAWLFKLLAHSSTPFNIVMFDLRECGYSTGVAHAQGLVLDGETIYQYVKSTLQVSEDHIDLCGFSLGAAIATLVKAKHPHTQGSLISNRSFQSLDHAVQGIFNRFSKPFSQFFGLLASKLTHTAGWALNPLEAWETISSPKMVICHPEDPVVSHSASLEQGLEKHNLLNACVHIQLHQKDPLLSISNHHVQPLSFYNDQHGQDAETVIFHFLVRLQA
jgi:hypothetical protein